MKENIKRSRWLVIGLLVMFANTACYNTYFVSPTQLKRLEANIDQKESVAVIVDQCDDKQGGASEESVQEEIKPTEEGKDPKTGCPVAVISTASPMYVATDTNKFRVTPFNFAVTDTQVVSPDYDLLLPMGVVKGAEVQTFSGWKTGLLITGVTAAAVGLFVGIQATSDDTRSFGN